MKKLLLLLFIIGFSSTIVNAQGDLPKAIQDINLEVEEINTVNKENGFLMLDGDLIDSFSLDDNVWINDNQINKIKEVNHLSGKVSITEYYFKYDRLIYLENLDDYNNSDPVVRQGYFSYDKLISQDYLIFEGKDTLFWGVRMQKEGYSLWKKYQTRLNFNPYSTIQYDSIVAYDFNGEGGGSIVYKDKLDKTAKNNTTLTQPQIDSLLFFVTDTNTYGNGTSACFDPHLGIVFYKDKKIISTIDVCFGCNYLVSSTHLPAQSYHSRVNTYDDYVIHQSYQGFSDEGKRRLLWLCKNLGLKYCKGGSPGLIMEIPTKEK